MQLDIGFGDSVTPPVVETAFPTILDGPAALLFTCPKETVLAEKFEAMVKLRISLLAMYSAAFISLEWFAAVRFGTSHRTLTVADPIWAALFDGKRNTYIVPPRDRRCAHEDSNLRLPLCESLTASA